MECHFCKSEDIEYEECYYDKVGARTKTVFLVQCNECFADYYVSKTGTIIKVVNKPEHINELTGDEDDLLGS